MPNNFTWNNSAPVLNQVGGNQYIQHQNVTSISSAYTFDDQLCLRTLRCPDSLLVKNRLKEKDLLVYKSIEWILQDQQYLSWRNGEDTGLLWIRGGAGKGKTMISIGLIERLLLPQNLPRSDHTVVAYFFCQNADYELNTVESIIKGLILRLVNQQARLIEPLRRRWDTVNNCFEEDVTSWRILWDILSEMLDRCECQKVYVIIDGLDECQDDSMADFLKLIVRTGLQHPPKVKWLLTSRPLDSAARELLTGTNQIQVSLELNLQHISESVRTYIGFKVDELHRRHRYQEALRQRIKTELNERAKGTYLWVSLVCKRLENVHPDEALAEIQAFPPGLDRFYHRICSQLSDEQSVDAKRRLRLLKVMTLAYRPLHLKEVESVTRIADQESAIEALVDQCASFINMRGSIIEFVHQSARDYLAGAHGQSILDLHECYGHGEIALNCLSYLSARLKVNILDLPRPDSTRGSIQDPKDKTGNSLLESVDYGATFWMQHLEVAKRTMMVQNALSERGVASEFLRSKFLEWLECLSLLDKLQFAVEGLKGMAKVTENTAYTSILVREATRFLLRHYHTLVNWPLQIYSSAIVFSPAASVMRTESLDKVPTWLKKIPQVESTWTSLIQTLVSHSSSVWAVGFSPDGKHIVSSSFDQTIKLWDATTGNLQKTLAGHSNLVRAVVFSPDGRLIASGSDDQTIKLWDVATVELQKTLEGHSRCADAVAFSPDGKHIAAGSENGTIKLWDVTTGELQKTFAGHSLYVVTSVAFSPDGKHIAAIFESSIKLWDATTGDFWKKLVAWRVHDMAFSTDGKHIAAGCDDETIRICDTTTGYCQKILSSGSNPALGHDNPVLAVAYSPDGRHIASGSFDGTIKLWDATTGDLQKTFAGHLDLVHAVAFSPDGKLIASASDDNSIKLWDATAGDLQETVEGHSGRVHAVVFSPDGKHIASNSYDSTIKLWDATTGDFRKELVASWVNDMTFSPDSKHIAAGSDYGTTKLWDVTTGERRKTLAYPSDITASCWVTAVAFSPDCRQIASGFSNGTIKLWDVTTDELQKTLSGHSSFLSSAVLALAFSPDCKHIVSGSFDWTIKIWNAMTGDLQKTLAGHWGRVNAVAFSPDGKQIASGSDDDTIKLWDLDKCLKTSRIFGTNLGRVFRFRSSKETKTLGRVYELKFSADGRFLKTNVGPIKLESLPAEGENIALEPLEELWVANQWIHYGSSAVLRLPMDFLSTCYDVQGDQVAIGFRNGRVLSFGMDRKRLELSMLPLSYTATPSCVRWTATKIIIPTVLRTILDFVWYPEDTLRDTVLWGMGLIYG